MRSDLHDIFSMKNAFPFIEEKMKEYQAKPEEVLVTIGLDRVIFQPSSPPFQIQNIYKYKEILTEISASLTEDQRYFLYNMYAMQEPLEMTELSAKDLIEDLQERGIRAIGLTAYLTGAFPGIEKNHEVWAAHLLQERFKIDFSNAFPDTEELLLRELPSYLGRYPCFYHGILHANGRADKGSKREALIAFLKYKMFTPKLLFQIDDLDDAFLLKTETKTLNSSIIHFGLKYRYGEANYADKHIVDTKTFTQAWVKLSEEVKINCKS